ncbi:WAT1-related protein At3g28050-like isoform X2 [Tasmannia lanceolata]|uniref:WAT1-related protein At3g28050-like isoform X2 n=1 Tax=Tasmannia lanceolata TaxID=3420 RepID=UPI0040645E66
MMCLWDVLPYAAMVIVEIFSVGMTTLSKAAMSKRSRPPITFRLLCRFFLLGLAGITIMQNCDFTGINYSSPTLGSALSNLVPAFTFIIAVVFRVENVDIRSSRSQAKFLGILISISGAMVVTFYKGLPIRFSSPSSSYHRHLLKNQSPPNSLIAENWILGALFLVIACLSSSVWNTFQAATVRGYLAEITIVLFSSIFGTIQCSIVSLIAERDSSAWRLRPDIELISIAYSAVFGGVITCTVQTWCIHKKGPVFVAMFKPLRIAIAAIMGTIFLGDTLHLGSVIGAVIIAVGFYGVIWGQTREEKKGDDKIVNGLKSSSQTMPLLQSEMEI